MEMNLNALKLSCLNQSKNRFLTPQLLFKSQISQLFKVISDNLASACRQSP